MTTSRFLRRLGFLMVLAALSVSMALPALALFDREEASGEGAPIAEAFSLTTYRDVAVSGTFSGVDPQGEALTFRVTKNPARGSGSPWRRRALPASPTPPMKTRRGRIRFPMWQWTRRATSPSRRKSR